MLSVPIWKTRVTLARERAGDVAALFEITPPLPQAVIIEEDPFGPDTTIEALYAEMPDGNLLSRLAQADINVALVPDQDWVKLSTEGLPPVRAGRFFVHGAHDKGVVPHGVIPLSIEAGLAFGTGHHESTALCLSLLSRLARRRRFRRPLDIGCGSGVLAIAIARLWKFRVSASDIDPVAVDVARANAKLNGAGTLVQFCVTDGLCDPIIAKGAPFDLIVANILAGPLTRLAPQIVRALAPGGVVALSGLLRWQENMVLGFYQSRRLVLRERRRDGPWSALLLERPRLSG